MAQRKSPPGGKPAAKKAPSRPTGAPATPTARAGSGGGANTRKPPPARKPGKSIVNQRQTPWGVIAAAVGVVLFAAAVIVVVVVTHKSSSGASTAGCQGANDPYCAPELPAAKQIPGVTYRFEPQHEHVTHVVKYDASPPIGGDHSAYWADCGGTAYPNPIANENAVHCLEHGSVWITYRQGALSASEIKTLSGDIAGKPYTLMSPYPNLKTKVSLQAWGYQLFVNSVNDPRIAEFVAVLAGNQQIAPEKNAAYQQPTFKAHPSTWGHPLFAPVSGSAATMSSSPAKP